MIDKKVVVGIAVTVLIVPILIFSRDRIASVWAAPEKVEAIEAKLEKTSTATEQMASLYLEQKARIDTEEKLNALREQNLREQLSIIRELKKT